MQPRRPISFWFPLIAALLLPSLAAAADPPWRIVSSDGKSSIQFGFLAQPQGEWLTAADGTGTARNLYLRRLRLIAGGKVNEKLSLFIETDSHQGTWLAEAGYSHRASRISPFVQVAGRTVGDLSLSDETRYQVGVAYWLGGHRLNLKLGVGQVLRDDAPDRTQVVLQGQVYMY